mgnify:CR=1 FL=1|tara:strand:- start:428 stop:1015 length:588 start_codon:yes stop_codon:yes gene_type:complete
MITQNIFIINFNLLYEILDEIKDNLSFKIYNFDNEVEFIRTCKLDMKNSLFITKTNQKLLINSDIGNKNFFDINCFPLDINKLIESINIQLMKIKFNHQSKVNIKGYELNLNSKFFSKKDLNLKLTEKEIEIILYLNNDKTKHDVLDLQKNIWGYSPDIETHTVETHIYRLRKKLKNHFNDHNFIISNQEGYFIE